MGGSGGGQSGAVSYPVYIESIQADWLANCGVVGEGSGRDNMSSYSVTDRMDAALGNSPFSGETAYDSATRITNWETEIGAFETIVDALVHTTDWATIFAQAVTTLDVASNWDAYTVDAATDVASAWLDPSGDAKTDIATSWLDPTPAADAEISADVDAFEAITDDRVESTVLPRFQRGMQDINAVMSSAFVIGQGIIEGMNDRDIAKYQGDLRTKAYLQKDALVAQSKLGESNRIADAHIQDDKITSDSNRGESDALALAHMQDDRLNADNVKGKNLAVLHSVEQMVRYFTVKMTSNEALTRITLQSEAMALETERTEAEDQRQIDEADAKWDLSIFQYGANLLAASGGAAFVPPPLTGPTRTQATIGGAASGAAMGAQATPGAWAGPAIGAVVGAYLGYSQSS